MLNTKALIRISLILCFLFSVSACGQKGDLYLPQGNVLSGWLK